LSVHKSTPILSETAHFHATFCCCGIPIVDVLAPAPLRSAAACGETPGMSQSMLQSIGVGTGNDARRIAVRMRVGGSPGLFWLGGFKSDMAGTKAVALDDWASAQGRACVRFDYSGHGESGGDFAAGTIGRWLEESVAVFERFAGGPTVLIGSSMGGWLALLLARELKQRATSPGSPLPWGEVGLRSNPGDGVRPIESPKPPHPNPLPSSGRSRPSSTGCGERGRVPGVATALAATAPAKTAGSLAGLVLIAPAVDFTEELMWKKFSAEVRQQIEAQGSWQRPSQYSEAPYPITRGLIEEGRRHLLLGGLIETGCPVRILQGVQDPDVPWQHAVELSSRLARDDVVLTLVKDGDHRLSRPEDIERLIAAVAEF
jgi:pimeloyl-ACP methyl ester carboxylesterase